MKYVLPNPSQITFHDKKVERFVEFLIGCIKVADASVEGFKSALDNDPFIALQDSAKLKLAAARMRTAKCYLELALDLVANGPDKTWAYIGATIRKDLDTRVVYHASRPPRSTNSESDEMAGVELRAMAELLKRFQDGEF
ncbi:hypothetical protein CcrC1_gp466 [Caulobacter phage C1]|nr:hypothetical protein CcrC1_gp466 [Caulobacter phage C1]UTU08676.1 hypothetical protein CcrC2_gp448 [Caulobacter phage C2]WGN97342.1 hypothetical protein [Bertelyvirus sp.]WGN97880.1 hypothetical protein [Bertelyvirus sp.]